jgi:hypothetical protein
MTLQEIYTWLNLLFWSAPQLNKIKFLLFMSYGFEFVVISLSS